MVGSLEVAGGNLLLLYPPTGITFGSVLGTRANSGRLAVGLTSVLSVSRAVFLLLAMALRIGPLSRVATASSTGPRSTWMPEGGCWGMRALEMPPTTAPSRPPAMASWVAELAVSGELVVTLSEEVVVVLGVEGRREVLRLNPSEAFALYSRLEEVQEGLDSICQ